MLVISGDVLKTYKKGRPPRHIYVSIYNALIEVDKTKDISLYDITDIQDQHNKYKYHYYRIRKGDYRGIFYFDNDNTYLYAIEKREVSYNKKQTKLI